MMGDFFALAKLFSSYEDARTKVKEKKKDTNIKETVMN